MTKPTIGTHGTFYPSAGGDPVRAEVVHVWSDTYVNLKTAAGDMPTSVLVCLDPKAPGAPSGYFFMPDAKPVETFLQPKITGYRQLSQAEVALMNEGKALAEQVGAYIAKLRGYPATPASGVPNVSEAGMPSLDQRWVSIGATDLQRGFMAVIRGIAQPTSF